MKTNMSTYVRPKAGDKTIPMELQKIKNKNKKSKI